jgi:hypothetical protein
MGRARLYSTTSVEEQWRDIAGPWLREYAGVAWKDSRPTVILTPSRAEGFYLRGRLVQEDIAFLGLRFWTPSDMRKFLLGELLPDLAAGTKAELRLLARICAESFSEKAPDATLASVIRDPGAFLRAYDLLLGAGWDPARDGAAYGRELSQAFQRRLKDLRLATQAGIHRELWREASSRPTALLANLLVVGFNATHWPLWDLLKAAVFSTEQALIALSAPREFGGEIDRLWIGSWEEITSSESLVPDASNAAAQESAVPFSVLAASYEKGDTAPSSATDLTLLVTPDYASQIRAVVLQALDYLNRDSCARLGIVFPEPNALALGVAQQLRRLGLPLDDGIGSLAPGIFEKRSWQSWIALQEEPGVQRLIAWVRACEADGVSCGIEQALSTREIAQIVDSALGESLVDDLTFLAGHLAENSDSRRAAIVADFLRARIVLPDTATFADFLALTRRALAMPGWQHHLARLETDPPAWLRRGNGMLSRRSFLEWLKETTDSQTRTRGVEGNHFYGKIHLLIYAQLSGQTWSHLILTGLNEGVWPRVFETGAFGSRHELMLLNEQARTLNREGTIQGGQGIGHETVRADRGHCLLPLERQDLALRDLCTALDSTSEGVSLTAMTTAGGRSLLPSDFFSHAYHAHTGRAFDEETFRHLATATAAWGRRHEALLVELELAHAATGKKRPVDANGASLAATHTAYRARRDPEQPFGAYEFAYDQTPPRPIQFSCKRWEDAWNHPATVWLEDVLGASPWPEGTLGWPRAVGTWVHRWLGTALRECRERNSAAELPVLVWAAADREAARVRRGVESAGIELYPWWDQVWSQARGIALGLSETLAPSLADRQFLSEFRLPGKRVALPGMSGPDFALTGRIDLLVIESAWDSSGFTNGDFTGCTCWVIDFKTGSASSLRAKSIGEGKGIQPLLYALAIQAAGAMSTDISFHTAGALLKKQVRLDDVLGLTPVFRALDKLHREGVFGMRPDAVNAYGYSPAYPMATRFIPRDILEAKWALVHGAAMQAWEKRE